MSTAKPTETKQQRAARAAKCREELLAGGAWSFDFEDHPRLPADAGPVGNSPSAMVALIAAVLRPVASSPAEAVSQAFELLELVEGGKRTLFVHGQQQPSYDKGIRESAAHRAKEIARCDERRLRKLGKLFPGAVEGFEEVDLDVALAKILPRNNAAYRREQFEAWVAETVDLNAEELEPVFKAWRKKGGRHGALAGILVNACDRLPGWHKRKTSGKRSDSGKKGAQAKNGKQGRVKDRERDKRIGAKPSYEKFAGAIKSRLTDFSEVLLTGTP